MKVVSKYHSTQTQEQYIPDEELQKLYIRILFKSLVLELDFLFLIDAFN